MENETIEKAAQAIEGYDNKVLVSNVIKLKEDEPVSEAPKEKREGYTKWAKMNKVFKPIPDADEVASLENGIYEISMNDAGIFVIKKDIILDELIDFESKEIRDVLTSFEDFWTREDKFRHYGFLFKRGILLYGPPGSGKTSIINLLCRKMMAEFDGVIFIINSADQLGLYSAFISDIFRQIEKTRKVITILEDIDGYCTGGSNETRLINILDGINQVDNIFYLATTNYPERLSERIVNRPNRFDRKIKIGFPSAELRREYFKKKLFKEDLESINLKYWVRETEGLTISHLGEIIKSVFVLGESFETAVKRMTDFSLIEDSKQLTKYAKKTIGFENINSGKEDDTELDYEDGDYPELSETSIEHTLNEIANEAENYSGGVGLAGRNYLAFTEEKNSEKNYISDTSESVDEEFDK